MYSVFLWKYGFLKASLLRKYRDPKNLHVWKHVVYSQCLPFIQCTGSIKLCLKSCCTRKTVTWIRHTFKDLVHDMCLSSPRISNTETNPSGSYFQCLNFQFLKGDIKLALTLINYYYNCMEQFKIGFEYVLRESYRNLLSRLKLVDLISTFITL